MDKNAAEFRAEVLKVKKERKEYGTKAKALESEQEKLQVEIKALITEVTKLRKNISEKEETIKVEKTEINKLNLEMVALENDKSKLWLQLNVVKQEAHREALNNYFPCTNCSFKTKSQSEIKIHNSENHQHHTQVEECSSQDSIEPLVPQFLEYPCFYCRKKIYQLIMLKSIESIVKRKNMMINILVKFAKLIAKMKVT